MPSNIKFIYFDIGNVLHTYANVFGTAAHDFGVTPDDIGAVFDRYVNEITTGVFDADGFWQLCCRELGIKNGENYNFVRSWVNDYVIFPQMHSLLPRLKQKYKLGILSNHYIGTFEETLSQNKIPPLDYDVVIISAQVGLQKPDPAIYQLAAKKSGVNPGEILFVDDKTENLATAHSLGWQIFLFDPRLPQESAILLEKMLLP